MKILRVILNFTIQPHIVCRYFIYGMQDSQNLERVVLSFDKFDIPAGKQINKSVFLGIDKHFWGYFGKDKDFRQVLGRF